MHNVDLKLLEETQVLMHPIRFRIIEMLKEKPMHINEMAEALEEGRRLVSYHLLILEEYGFVSTEYELSKNGKSRGRTIRKYLVSGKLVDMISQLKEKL